MRAALGCLLGLIILAAAVLFARDYVRRHPQDFPWTRLDLAHPMGAFTGRKLAAKGDEPAQCRMLLLQAGLEDMPVDPRRASPDCGYDDGVQLVARGAREIGFQPAPLIASCPVAAALFLLEERVMQSAARRHLGSQVTAVEHAGSYSCRRLYGREEGAFSEHATADALDITGFRLADGSRVSVLEHWEGDTRRSAFLRDVRDGACRLFSTVLSPDYNEAHADHLHLDQAERGSKGWRMCR